MLEAQGRREFSGDADQVAAARRFVASAITGRGPARDVSRLLVSEAATNAVLHSASGDGGTFSVRYLVSDHLLRVEVADGGGATGPPTNIATGGPAGAGDAYLQNVSGAFPAEEHGWSMPEAELEGWRTRDEG